jgi:hypothetical protein
VSKKFGEWYQKTNKTEYTNKLTLLAFEIIAILHNTLLATFIKFLETVSKGLFRNRSQNRWHTFLDFRHVAAIQERVTAVLQFRIYGGSGVGYGDYNGGVIDVDDTGVCDGDLDAETERFLCVSCCYCLCLISLLHKVNFKLFFS